MQATHLHSKTPVIRSHKMSALTGKEVFLKMECYQPVGSFKIRGMGKVCQQLCARGITNLYAASGGNAGYAIAYVGRKLGAKVTIVVPEKTSTAARETIAAEGADVKIFGEGWDDAHQHALVLAKQASGGYIHPFDDPVVWDGNSTLIDECITQCPKPDAIVVSVGGGGLFNGVMLGLQRHVDWQDVPVITVETQGADSLYASVKAGRQIRLDAIRSLAVTLGVKEVANKAFEYGQTEQVTPVTVTDAAAVNACQNFLHDHRVLVEPACGASLAVIYDKLDILEDADSVLIIVCGGIGVSLQGLRQWQKALGRKGD